MTDLALWKANGEGLWGNRKPLFKVYCLCVLCFGPVGSVAAQRPPPGMVCVLLGHSKALGSVAAPQVMTRGLGCSTACAVSPEQGLKPSPLHWQADS